MVRLLCGLCTKGIGAMEQLVFVGETDAGYYLEPPLHQDCAAYALQVCPRLHAAGERIEVALAQTYTLLEDRITGMTAGGSCGARGSLSAIRWLGTWQSSSSTSPSRLHPPG
ncbi:hypothetical protein ABZ599_33000 [Streptomyces misionensis]|uniref:hypothetical protein n=1 Tax=Streptomyces misionensis TaxID=67331 RepID=UPI0033DE589B